MVFIKAVRDGEVEITDAYLVEDASALEISNCYSNDEEDEKYRCYDFSQYGVVMVSDEGVWTEFEVITPQFTERPFCICGPAVERKTGFPLIRIEGAFCPAAVEKKLDQWTLWLERDRIIDTVVWNQPLEFLISQDHLVGITVRKADKTLFCRKCFILIDIMQE